LRVCVGTRDEVPRCAIGGLEPDLSRPIQLRRVRVPGSFASRGGRQPACRKLERCDGACGGRSRRSRRRRNPPAPGGRRARTRAGALRMRRSTSVKTRQCVKHAESRGGCASEEPTIP
jgi:hypothetical protein